MFKKADRSRRTPVWLQAHTKENIIWQIAMIPVVIGALEAKDWYLERKHNKNTPLVKN